MSQPHIHHDGTPSSPNEHFCADFDACLGELRSCDTTDREGPSAGPFRALRRSQCTYVGSLGVARYRRWLSRVRNEILVFTPTTELRVTRDASMRGRSMHTHVRYEFRDGAVRFCIEARVVQGVEPGPNAPIRFGEAAEKSYSEYVLRSYDAELAEHGHVRFVLNAQESICVGPGFVEVRAGEKTARLDATSLRSVVVNRGAVELRSDAPSHADMRAQSIFRIRIEPGHHVHALAVLLQELVGVRMG